MKTYTLPFKYLGIFGLLMGCLLSLSGQGQMGIALQYGQSLDQFAEKNYRDGWGMSSYVLAAPMPLPSKAFQLQLGGRFDFSSHGSEEYTLDVTLGKSDPETWVYGVQNNRFGLHGMARIISTDRFPVQLYVDGLMGGSFFFSEEYAHLENSCEDGDFDVVANNFTFSYGATLGTLIRISDKTSLDLKATLMQGQRARYVDLSSVSFPENQLTYATTQAPAQQLLLGVGLNVKLFRSCGKSQSEDRSSCSGGGFFSCGR